MKLFKLLHQLDKRTLTRFEQFLSTPLFNHRLDVLDLFKIWKFEKGRSYPSTIYWSKLFPTQPYQAKQWNLLTSRLFKLLEEFLSLNEIRKDQAQNKFYLAKAYRRMQQEQRFKEAIRDTRRALKKQDFRDTEYLKTQHDVSFEAYDYIISINRKEKTNLQEVSNYLDAYIIAAKLRQACYALSREIIKQERYQIGFLDEVLNAVKTQPCHLDTPAIAIYYYCFQAISSENNEVYFLKLRETIAHSKDIFPPSEMRDIYTLTINYAIKRLNTGASLFIREALELYQLSLDQGYLLEDGILLESAYSNIVFLAVKLKEYERARIFIHQYQSHLKPAFQEPLFHLSLGKLLYEQGQLKNSLEQLIQVETKASFLLLGARILQLKIYYELEDFDALERLLESLRVYVQRSKDLAYRKKHYSNILSFTRQLLQLPVMDKQERIRFRERILSTEIFAEKDWFLKQIHSEKDGYN